MFGNTLVKPPVFVDYESVANPSAYLEAQTQGGFIGPQLGSPSTQKARGVFFLQDKQQDIRNVFWSWSVPKHILFRSGIKFDAGSFNFPVFARPCPVNPRHGFVDSTLCKDAEELNKISAAAYYAEKEAEILVTKPVKSHYNAIINGNVITFSDGNDGATAGRNCKYFYISEDPLSSMLDLDKRKVVAPDETPFYEFVFGPSDESRPVNLVQVRSAPKTPRVKDFIPAQVTVKTILKAEGDLLDWEALLKTVDPTTTVVDHTDGSLSSHYAIHAIVNKVPIFTTYLPAIGSVVEPTVENMDITPQDRADFSSSFAKGFFATKNIWDKCKYPGSADQVMGNIVRIALSTLHNYSSLALSKDYQLLGMVLGLFSRVTFAVSGGETRYNKKRSDKFLFSKNYYNKVQNSSRSSYYKHFMSIPVSEMVNDIVMIYRVFEKMKWDNNYGGKRWASCTKSAVELFSACAAGDIKSAVQLFNRVINENHNGGKYLNKVVSSSDFDEASHQPSIYALKNFSSIVDILSVAWEESKAISAEDIASITPIDLSWGNEKNIPNEHNKLKNAWIKPTSDRISKVVVCDESGKEWDISIPEVDNDYGVNCVCHNCVPTMKFELHSVPLWFVTPTGSKVVSKTYLSRQLAKLGIFNLKIA